MATLSFRSVILMHKYSLVHQQNQYKLLPWFVRGYRFLLKNWL
jgi:hypothetical protein